MNVQKPVYECTGICKQAGRAVLLLQRPASVHLRFKRWTRNYLLDARPCLLVAEEEDLRGVVVLVLEAPVLRALTDVLGASGHSSKWKSLLWAKMLLPWQVRPVPFPWLSSLFWH